MMLSYGEGLHEFRSAPTTQAQKKLSRKPLGVIVVTTDSNRSDYNGSGNNFIISTHIYPWIGRGDDEIPFDMFNIKGL